MEARALPSMRSHSRLFHGGKMQLVPLLAQWALVSMLSITGAHGAENDGALPRVTLMGLLASVGHRESPNAVTWEMHQQVYKIEELEEALRHARKPIVCEALVSGSQIHVNLRDMTNEKEK